MENASKALIMAASILIGIIIISLAVYLFVTFGATSAEVHKQIEIDRLNHFNNQFTSYEGKEDITIYDIVTLANLATENNKYYEFTRRTSIPSNDTNDNYIFVTITKQGQSRKNIEFGINNNSTEITNKYNQIIKDDINQISSSNDALIHYSCKTTVSSITGRVYKVEFVQK